MLRRGWAKHRIWIGLPDLFLIVCQQYLDRARLFTEEGRRARESFFVRHSLKNEHDYLISSVRYQSIDVIYFT